MLTPERMIEINALPVEKVWEDLPALSEDDWHSFVTSFVTTEPIETSYQECAENFWRDFRPQTKKWIAKGSHLIEAAERGYDSWIKLQLKNLSAEECARLVNKFNKNTLTALHKAVSELHINTAEILLQNGANPNAANTLSETPLHQAAEHGSVLLVKLLLKYHANPSQTNFQFNRPIHIAARKNQESVVAELLGHLETNLTTDSTPGHNGKSLFLITIEYASVDVLQLLISKGLNIDGFVQPGRTALQHVAREHNYHAVKILLEANADINLGLKTPLVLAVVNAVNPSENAKKTVKLLIDSGAETIYLDDYANTNTLSPFQKQLCKIASSTNDLEEKIGDSLNAKP